MRFEVFGKPDCAMCRSTKDKLTHLLAKGQAADAVGLAFVDMNSIQGRAEGAFYDVRHVPTTLLWSDDEEPLARWEGCIPPSAEIKTFLSDVRQVSPV
jgi:thioredoxin-like negative regulator of GroEL